jgi:hypothetical protein
MKKVLSTIAAALAATALVASAAQGVPATQSEAAVHPWLNADLTLGGYSKVVRNDNGIGATFHAEGLTPGTATTMWWVFFNNPSACQHPMVTSSGTRISNCGLADVLNASIASAAGASVQFAAGHVTGGDGQASFGSYFSVGATPQCASAALPCAGLADSRRAEVHLVLRTHGDAVPGFIDEQISSFNGGCLAGEPNVGQCRNIQFSVQNP